MNPLYALVGIGLLGAITASTASSAEQLDYLCYMTNAAGQTINLTYMCGRSAKDAAAKAKPSFVSEERDFTVTNLKLKRDTSGAFVEVSGSIKNTGEKVATINYVTLQLEHQGTILKQINARVDAELEPGKSFIFRDTISKGDLEGIPLSKVEVKPIRFEYK